MYLLWVFNLNLIPNGTNVLFIYVPTQYPLKRSERIFILEITRCIPNPVPLPLDSRTPEFWSFVIFTI